MRYVVFRRTEKDWRIAEKKAHNWFIKNGYDSLYMDFIKKNNRGFDILVENTYRIDVKHANPKKNNQNAFDFKINKKKKVVKTTDYYLLMFKDLDISSNTYKLRAYLIPYEDVRTTDVITITKTRLKKWEQYKFNINNLENLGIIKNGKAVA